MTDRKVSLGAVLAIIDGNRIVGRVTDAPLNVDDLDHNETIDGLLAQVRALPTEAEGLTGFRVKGGQGSHWEDCYKTHADCADRLIEEQRRQLEALRALDRARNGNKDAALITGLRKAAQDCGALGVVIQPIGESNE